MHTYYISIIFRWISQKKIFTKVWMTDTPAKKIVNSFLYCQPLNTALMQELLSGVPLETNTSRSFNLLCSPLCPLVHFCKMFIYLLPLSCAALIKRRSVQGNYTSSSVNLLCFMMSSSCNTTRHSNAMVVGGRNH